MQLIIKIDPTQAEEIEQTIVFLTGLLALNAGDVPTETSATEWPVKRFLNGLGSPLKSRIKLFFLALATGPKTATEMAAVLGLKRNSELGSTITTHIKRRCKLLGVELPWAQSDDGEVVWSDRNGLASKIVKFLDQAENSISS